MFEKRYSRIRLKLNLMDVIIIHEVEFKAYATAVILCGSFFLGTLPPMFSHKNAEQKQDGMLADFEKRCSQIRLKLNPMDVVIILDYTR